MPGASCVTLGRPGGHESVRAVRGKLSPCVLHLASSLLISFELLFGAGCLRSFTFTLKLFLQAAVYTAVSTGQCRVRVLAAEHVSSTLPLLQIGGTAANGSSAHNGMAHGSIVNAELSGACEVAEVTSVAKVAF